MLFLAVIFIVFMIFAACGFAYYGGNPGWRFGPYCGFFLWACVAILGWVVFHGTMR